MVKDDVGIAADLDPNVENSRDETCRKRTLGNVRLMHHDNQTLILVPRPTSDPNDPLNWPRWKKYYIATVLCVAMAMCNFLAAGPSIAIVRTAADFFPGSTANHTLVSYAIPKVAYFFTTTSLLQGTGNLIWVPVANKWGRRPVYILSYLIYFGTSVWLIFDKSYGGFLAGRILMGFGAGAAETIAPISIADIFYLHERGSIMSAYTCFLSVGVAAGIIISGLITISHPWRTIYEVGSALVGFVLLLAVFTFPETAYPRQQSGSQRDSPPSAEKLAATCSTSGYVETAKKPELKRESYLRSLRLFRGTLTDENLLKMVIRPFGLIMLPPVLWAALVQAATIGFLVAVTSNVDPAFEEAYHFKPYQVGLCFFSAVIGSLLGLPAGGLLGDKVAAYLTKRNGGIREPEMRLPAIMLSCITSPLALVLFGVGIQHRLHWICPTIGLGLLNFSITQATNICLVYVIDAYRPVAGEITLAVMGFKSLFGFLLSFETNPWINQSGYQNAYGAMAGISAGVLILWVPLYFWGKKVRHSTWKWPMVAFVHWDDDREVGE
ncbi:putative MFS-type transporter [Purpureocillium lavendulum]|uniref:MFS-type transporter n=1 Tax=Purpureocillium lavendulum TaxID=1247861 RepID=A0AB34G597_9HYPO|nr:putative MFS-type transporter [Purpureocillium lavendulum]